ncbi:hypothetical protein LEMLEM_LOCUS9702 [Lemmus lemmus]
MPCNRSRPSLYSLSYIKRGKTRNYLYPIWSPYAYYLYCYKYRFTLREKMLPCYCYRSITYKEQEDLTAPESLEGLQVGRSTEQEKDHSQLKELYSLDSNIGICGGEDQCGLCVSLDKSGISAPPSSLLLQRKLRLTAFYSVPLQLG